MGKDLLFEKLFRDLPVEDASLEDLKSTVAAVRSRYAKGNELSVSLGVLCRVAQARGVNPTLALLSLVASRLERGRDHIKDESLARQVREALESLADHLSSQSPALARPATRTLENWPHAFAPPYYVVTGDRRERKREKRITPADFGVVSSSAAELRHIFRLGLPRDTQVVTDKMFILTPYDELCDRFAEATIICVGSPASNALSRILNRYSIHRYNLKKDHYDLVEDFIRDAWVVGTDDRERHAGPREVPHPDFFVAPAPVPIERFNGPALEEFIDRKKDELSWMKHSTFAGGFIDPATALRIRGLEIPPDGDFGIITLSQNPFRKTNDGKHPAVLISGYHLPGTYYGLHPSIWEDPSTFFAKHRLGGIIKVDLKPPTSHPRRFYTFYERMENFSVDWDANSDYEIEDLFNGLEDMSRSGGGICHLTKEEASRALDFVRKLLSSQP
jgi:hypothetical protein